ncbi:hypothetical protein, partial [Gemmatimonas sp.]|uniref:hypothetical protein n=1 Tax=Gemmatimonas sp. TaxID=1962908 RepID=UPI0037BE21AB
MTMSLNQHSNESAPTIPEPWAAGRTSVFELLSAGPGAMLDLPDLRVLDAEGEPYCNRSLEDLASDLSIFRVAVKPCVASIPEGAGLVPIVMDLLKEASRGSNEEAAQLYL